MPRRLILALISFVCILSNSALSAQTNVWMLVPGFTVQELPLKLSNVNNLRFAPDGRLTALGYDGRIHILRDTDGDGLEDRADIFWDNPTLSVPVGMAWSNGGLYVSSHGKVSLLRDSDGDGRADTEEITASGWPATDVGSGGVDATAVTLDAEGNVYFGLLVADYSNAYRLRKRKDLKPEEKAWLVARGQQAEGDPEDEVSLYDINSPRGTIQKWNARTKKLETVATGVRVPYALAFNRAEDLFLTDQEGETWMPNGNPLDELNHIVPGRNYGFPPQHPKWLPNLVSEPPVVAFGPQHQSTCGFVFNEPHTSKNPKSEIRNPKSVPLPSSPGQGLFGPKSWAGDALVAGESRGKIWRVRLVKTPQGYVGSKTIIARLSMLTTDVAISPDGALYLSCHSGGPDWGTGPNGPGKIFKITYSDPAAPQPVLAWAASPTEVRVAFEKPLDPIVTNDLQRTTIEFGEYVSAGDRFELLKPPYRVVQEQMAAPRGELRITGAKLDDLGQALVLTTEPHTTPAQYALSIPNVRALRSSGQPEAVEIDYGLTTNTAWISKPRLLSRAPSGAKLADSAAGDWEAGHELFLSEKLQCARCHRVRGAGGMIGPDLSNLVHRDAASVLRDVREPNAAINPDYVTYNVTRADGEQFTGFIRAHEADQLRVTRADGKEVIVARTELKDFAPSAVSLMPTGLLDALKENQVRDLMTFLMHEPPVRSRAEVDAVLGQERRSTGDARLSIKPLNIVLVASKQDHGPGQHDYPAWQKKWMTLLGQAPGVTATEAWEWPTPTQWQKADVVVFYFWNHDWSAERYRQLDEHQARGGGVVVFHSATIADKEPEKLAERIGLAAQPGPTKYLHTPFLLDFVAPTNHAIACGFKQLKLLDEPYWPMFGDTNRIEVLAEADVDGQARPLIWTFWKGPGRVFASIIGHYTWTVEDPLFRVLALRGLAWAAGEPVERLETLK